MMGNDIMEDIEREVRAEMRAGMREKLTRIGLTAGTSVILALGAMRVAFDDPGIFPVRWVLASILCAAFTLFDSSYFHSLKPTPTKPAETNPIPEKQPRNLDNLLARRKELKIQLEHSTWAKGEFCKKLDRAVVTMGYATKEKDMEVAKARYEREKEGLWEAICENERCGERLKNMEKSLALLGASASSPGLACDEESKE
jgi:hypothetical protein